MLHPNNHANRIGTNIEQEILIENLAEIFSKHAIARATLTGQTIHLQNSFFCFDSPRIFKSVIGDSTNQHIESQPALLKSIRLNAFDHF